MTAPRRAVLYKSGSPTITRIEVPARLHLIGDVDVRTLPLLDQALADLLHDTREAHPHLAGLTFIDVRGLGLLLDTAESLYPGGRLIPHGLPTHLTHIMRLTGWDTTPGLTLTKPEPPQLSTLPEF